MNPHVDSQSYVSLKYEPVTGDVQPVTAPASASKLKNAFKQLMFCSLRLVTFLVAGFVLFVWCIVSCRGLIRHDTIEPAVSMGGPVNHTLTLFCCLSPIGWFLALGVFSLAFVMALIIYRWPWLLRIVITAAIPAWMVYHTAYANIDIWVWKVLIGVTSIQVLLAVLAAIFCRSIAKWLLRDVPEWSKLSFFADLWQK
jgi:mannose/fructose/N-acetylgalactosamine-specific phosphotransferase system component IIC